MKKAIFTFSFIVIALLLSSSIVFANNNPLENIKNNMVDTVNNAGNVVQDTASGTAGAVKNGTNAVQNTAQNMTNGVMNAGENIGNDVNNMGNMDYTAERTSTETNAAADSMNNNLWTWIIVGIIAAVVIGLIWYFVSQNNH